jgi:hypothetical protein
LTGRLLNVFGATRCTNASVAGASFGGGADWMIAWSTPGTIALLKRVKFSSPGSSKFNWRAPFGPSSTTRRWKNWTLKPRNMNVRLVG